MLPREADAAVHLDRALADRRRPPRRPASSPAAAATSALLRRPGRRTRPPRATSERASSSSRVRVGERVRDRLVDADRPSELLARARRARSRTRAHAARRRTPRARAPRACGCGSPPGRSSRRARRPGSPPRTTPSGARLVARGQHLPLGALELVDPVPADDRDPVGRVEVRRRADRAQASSSSLRWRPRPASRPAERARRARRSRSTGRGRARARAPRRARPPRGRPRPAPPSSSGDRDPGPAELGELVPRRLRGRGEERARLLAERVLLGCEGGIHQRDLGNPSTRSATMLRSISEVPASIVFPRLRSCWCCQ